MDLWKPTDDRWNLLKETKNWKNYKYRTVREQGEYRRVKRAQLGMENKIAILEGMKERKNNDALLYLERVDQDK